MYFKVKTVTLNWRTRLNFEYYLLVLQYTGGYCNHGEGATSTQWQPSPSNFEFKQLLRSHYLNSVMLRMSFRLCPDLFIDVIQVLGSIFILFHEVSAGIGCFPLHNSLELRVSTSACLHQYCKLSMTLHECL